MRPVIVTLLLSLIAFTTFAQSNKKGKPKNQKKTDQWHLTSPKEINDEIEREAKVEREKQEKLRLEEEVKIDPFTLGKIAFKSDTIYIKTDTAFQVEQWYFVPGKSNQAKITRDVTLYPKNFTVDSLAIKNGFRRTARLYTTYIYEGTYAYSPDIPNRMTFIDNKKTQSFEFTISSTGLGKNRKIQSLKDNKTNAIWKSGEGPESSIVSF